MRPAQQDRAVELLFWIVMIPCALTVIAALGYLGYTATCWVFRWFR